MVVAAIVAEGGVGDGDGDGVVIGEYQEYAVAN